MFHVAQRRHRRVALKAVGPEAFGTDDEPRVRPEVPPPLLPRLALPFGSLGCCRCSLLLAPLLAPLLRRSLRRSACCVDVAALAADPPLF